MRKLKLKQANFNLSYHVCFVMISSTVVVSIIVRQQSEHTSNDQIQKALNVVKTTYRTKRKRF